MQRYSKHQECMEPNVDGKWCMFSDAESAIAAAVERCAGILDRMAYEQALKIYEGDGSEFAAGRLRGLRNAADEIRKGTT